MAMRSCVCVCAFPTVSIECTCVFVFASYQCLCVTVNESRVGFTHVLLPSAQRTARQSPKTIHYSLSKRSGVLPSPTFPLPRNLK